MTCDTEKKGSVYQFNYVQLKLNNVLAFWRVFRKLLPVITCLGERFGINCPSAFLKIGRPKHLITG